MSRSPKTAKNAADRLFSQRVRTKGRCERCGTTDTLQCAHWISRRYAWTRTHPWNAFCLCARCHRWFTDHPTEFSDWALDKRGRAAYRVLLERSQRRDKFPWLLEERRLKGDGVMFCDADDCWELVDTHDDRQPVPWCSEGCADPDLFDDGDRLRERREGL